MIHTQDFLDSDRLSPVYVVVSLNSFSVEKRRVVVRLNYHRDATTGRYCYPETRVTIHDAQSGLRYKISKASLSPNSAPRISTTREGLLSIVPAKPLEHTKQMRTAGLLGSPDEENILLTATPSCETSSLGEGVAFGNCRSSGLGWFSAQGRRWI